MIIITVAIVTPRWPSRSDGADGGLIASFDPLRFQDQVYGK